MGTIQVYEGKVGEIEQSYRELEYLDVWPKTNIYYESNKRVSSEVRV